MIAFVPITRRRFSFILAFVFDGEQRQEQCIRGQESRLTEFDDSSCAHARDKDLTICSSANTGDVRCVKSTCSRKII